MIEIVTMIGFSVLLILIGVILSPVILFLRARRDPAWDDSNVFNMYRLVGHIVAHPSDFGKLRFEDGSNPFWYINKDEYSEVVKTRP